MQTIWTSHQADNHAKTSWVSFCGVCSPWRPTDSVKALKESCPGKVGVKRVFQLCVFVCDAKGVGYRRSVNCHIQWTSIRCSLARWHWSWEIRCAWMCVLLLCVRLIHILNAVTWTICVVYHNTLRVVFRMWTELSCVDVQFSSSFCVDMSTPVSVVWTYQRCHRAHSVVFSRIFDPAANAVC